MITTFRKDTKKVYELFTRKDWKKHIRSGKYKFYDIKIGKFFGIEITNKSPDGAILRRDKHLKKEGVIPYESMADFIKNEGVVMERTARYKAYKLRQKKRKEEEWKRKSGRF